MTRFPSLSARASRSQGFTLLELLVVIGIISILLVMATPAILSLIGGNRLTAAGERITAFLSDAQQSASAHGSAYEVRFIEERVEGIGEVFRSLALCRTYQIGEPNPDPSGEQEPLTQSVSVIVGDLLVLPEEVIISQSSEGSPLISETVQESGSGGVPQLSQIRANRLTNFLHPSNQVTGRVARFIIRPEGTNLLSGSKWFITLGDISEFTQKGDDPTTWKNFFCLQIDPINGRLTTYRP